MIISEVLGDYSDVYYKPENDKSVLGFDDTRKTRITLKQLNMLRHLMDARKLDAVKTAEMAAIQYGTQGDGSGEAPGPF